jgi:hypothetical protein
LHFMWYQCSDRCGSAAMLCMPRRNAAQACRPKSALREFALDDTPSGSMITSSPTPAPGSAMDDASAGNDACKVVIDAQVTPVPMQMRHGASPVPAQMCVRFAQASNGELHVKAATLGGLVALLSSNTMLHWKLLEARCALKNTWASLEYQSTRQYVSPTMMLLSKLPTHSATAIMARQTCSSAFTALSYVGHVKYSGSRPCQVLWQKRVQGTLAVALGSVRIHGVSQSMQEVAPPHRRTAAPPCSLLSVPV